MAIFHKKVLRYLVDFIMYLQVLGKMNFCLYLKVIGAVLQG